MWQLQTNIWVPKGLNKEPWTGVFISAHTDLCRKHWTSLWLSVSVTFKFVRRKVPHLFECNYTLKHTHLYGLHFWKSTYQFPPIIPLFLHPKPVWSVCSPLVEEENPEFWRSQAQKTLQSVLDRKLNTDVAKNILFFLGDGRLHNMLIFSH